MMIHHCNCAQIARPVSRDPRRNAVVKRNGQKQAFSRDKVQARIKQLTYGLNGDFIDADVLTRKVCEGAYDNVPTAQVVILMPLRL